MGPSGNSNEEDVAVFWDYENCPAPASSTGYDLVDAIRRTAQKFGSVKLFKAYLEVSEQILNSRSLTLRSELQVSGVSLTDCPHNGRKDAADKMMLVDMLAHAIDHPAPRTFILISGDRDFAYALSTLRLRRYKVVLVTLPNAHVSLRAQATICLDWFTDVVDTISFPPSSPKKSARVAVGNGGSRSSSGAYEDGNNSEVRYTMSSGGVVEQYTGKQATAGPGLPSHIKNGQTSDLLEAASPPGRSSGSPSQSPKKKAHNEIQPNQTTLNQFWEVQEHEPFRLPPRAPLRGEKTDIRTEYAELQTQPLLSPASEDVSAEFFGPLTRKHHTAVESQGPTPRPSGLATPFSLPSLGLTVNQGTLPSTASSETVEKVVADSVGVIVAPDPFKPLVRQLQWYHSHGTYIVLRSTISSDLVIRYKGVYKRANVKNFIDYALLAEKAGIVELGGTGADAWIRMLPGWEKADTRW